MRPKQILALSAVWVGALAACQQEGAAPALREDAPPMETVGQLSEQGQPTAPIELAYNVIGSAFVGEPVNIEVEVSSSVRDRAIGLEYRINDPRDLALADAQPPRVSLSAIGGAPSATRQVTVVPKREGRVYLNVSAEIETQEGSLIRAISIPLQVGPARGERQAGGEAEQADGGTVPSNPADEN